MKTYNTILKWHQNTSNAGQEQILAEQVSLKDAEDALMNRIARHDNASVNLEDGIIEDSDYRPSQIWVRGDGSLRYGDYTIVIEEN